MDKYLLFVRFVVRRVFAGMVQDAVNEEDIKEGEEVQKRQIALLENFPLSPRERKVPDGLRYHVLDIYVDELERAVPLGRDGDDDDEEEQGEGEISEETRTRVERLLVPVETVAREGLSKGVRVRAKEVLADERVVRWRTKGKGESRSGAGGEEEDEQDDEWGGLE